VKRYGVAAESREEMYVPLAQRPFTRMTIVLKSQGDVESAVATIRREVQALDPGLPVYDYRAMTEVVSGTIAGPRIAAVLSVSFAIVAAILAVVGIYGVMAFVVATRRKEIGIRSALGADRGAILGLVGRQAAALALAGTVAGVLASLAITQLLQGFVFQVDVTSLATYLVLSLAMFGVVLLASAVPTLRAAKISPLVALNEE
jgi:ABC-type antimicrobial peptide transport system permease subunit